jgi:hypothetical protein
MYHHHCTAWLRYMPSQVLTAVCTGYSASSQNWMGVACDSFCFSISIAKFDVLTLKLVGSGAVMLLRLLLNIVHEWKKQATKLVEITPRTFTNTMAKQTRATGTLRPPSPLHFWSKSKRHHLAQRAGSLTGIVPYAHLVTTVRQSPLASQMTDRHEIADERRAFVPWRCQPCLPLCSSTWMNESICNDECRTTNLATIKLLFVVPPSVL